MDIRITPHTLNGAVTPPASKSMAHRAVLAMALADKKRSGGDITLVIPKRIGACELKKVPVTELLPIIRAGLEG